MNWKYSWFSGHRIPFRRPWITWSNKDSNSWPTLMKFNIIFLYYESMHFSFLSFIFGEKVECHQDFCSIKKKPFYFFSNFQFSCKRSKFCSDVISLRRLDFMYEKWESEILNIKKIWDIDSFSSIFSFADKWVFSY